MLAECELSELTQIQSFEAKNNVLLRCNEMSWDPQTCRIEDQSAKCNLCQVASVLKAAQALTYYQAILYVSVQFHTRGFVKVQAAV